MTQYCEIVENWISTNSLHLVHFSGCSRAFDRIIWSSSAEGVVQLPWHCDAFLGCSRGARGSRRWLKTATSQVHVRVRTLPISLSLLISTAKLSYKGKLNFLIFFLRTLRSSHQRWLKNWVESSFFTRGHNNLTSQCLDPVWTTRWQSDATIDFIPDVK